MKQQSRNIRQSTLDIKLESPMSVRGFEASTVEEALGSDPTLLVFLRHFG